MAQLIPHHQHGQRRIQVRQIIYRHQQGLRQRYLRQIQHHGHRHADHAGIQQQGLQPQLPVVAGQGVHAPGPADHREHDHIRGAVEHPDAAQQRRHQRIAHKAAVGKHRREPQAPLAVAILVPDQQQRHGDEHRVQQRRHAGHHAEIVQRGLLQRPLEGHHHHAGGHHIHHQIAHGRGGVVVQQPDLTQYEAHHQQQVQRNDLLAHGEK